MTNRKEFQVGDLVFLIDYSERISKHEVVRTTKTQAILNNDARLKIKDTNGCTAIGSGLWSNNYYYLETPQLREKYLHQKLRRGISKLTKVIESLSGKKNIIECTELHNKLRDLVDEFSEK